MPVKFSRVKFFHLLPNATEVGRYHVCEAVPFPAQGHLNYLLHFSLHLTSWWLPMRYAASAEHVCQARVHGWGKDALRRVEFHDITISEYGSPLPNPTASSPCPSQLMPLLEAFTAIAPAMLLHGVSASHHHVVVVYDNANTFSTEEAANYPMTKGSCSAAPPHRRLSGGWQAGPNCYVTRTASTTCQSTPSCWRSSSSSSANGRGTHR